MTDLDLVELVTAVHPMPVGALGLIVVVHDGGEAFDVEFSDEHGALAMLTVTSDQIRPVD